MFKHFVHTDLDLGTKKRYHRIYSIIQLTKSVILKFSGCISGPVIVFLQTNGFFECSYEPH
jgi:hypothetical protein